MSEQTIGQRIARWFNGTLASPYGSYAASVLSEKIDAELAKSAPKRVLDLTGIPQERRLSVSEKKMVPMVNIDHVKAAIRTQLPDVEVRT